MTFEEVLTQAIAMLQRLGRVSYRALKRQFDIDDDYLEDVKEALIYAHPQVVDDGQGLIWPGEKAPPDAAFTTPSLAQQEVSQATQLIQADTPPPAPGTPDAERRQLTVMFCDLADSTRLSGKLDPEDLRDVIRAYQSTSAEVIERYDGYIAQHLGDGLMVYFGWPQAHEDDAQRAVHVGLGILEAMSDLNVRLEQEKCIRLGMRIGIHTGLVVVGEIGKGASQEHLALGETPNVASRIEGIAAPDTVAISAVTYQLVQGYFICEDLGQHVLKGVSHAQQIYRVLRESDAQGRLDVAAVSGLTPLIGRESEVTLLLERWQQVKEGQGQVVLLSGEAGIGKSRLLRVLREHIANQLHTLQACRCSPYHTQSAFYPLIDLLQRKLAWQSEDAVPVRLRKLETVLGQTLLDSETAVPLFSSLLSLPLPDGRYAPLTLSSQRQRQETLEAFLRIVLLATEQHPVLFMVEDVHWVDPSTLEFLDLLIGQAATAALLIVLTCRPEFQSPWGLRSYLTPIALNRLTRSQIEQMVGRVSGGKGLPPEVIGQLVEKTDGVPLYIEEMTKAVLESGVLQQAAGDEAPTAAIRPLAIPATLQDSLMARLDRLGSAKAVAQYGAVIGRQFSYDLLRSVAQLDEVTLQQALRRLVESELLYQRGLPPQSTYMFKHALVQDTAYQSLLKSTRQQYHQCIAQVLSVRFPETIEMQPELLAHHYTEAGRYTNAVSYWHQAGQRALERSAYEEAIAHLTKGLQLLALMPESVEYLQQELDFQVALGSGLRATKGFAAPEIEHAYTRARELCQQLGDSPQLFSVLRGLSLYHFSQGQLQTATELAEQLLCLAQTKRDPALLMLAHFQLGLAALFRGEPAVAYTHHTQVMAIYTPKEHKTLALGSDSDPGVASHGYLAREQWYLGYPDQAVRHIQRARTLVKEVSHPYTVTLALVNEAFLHHCRREMSATQNLAVAAMTMATEQGFSFRLAWGLLLHGWALVMQGQGEAGIAEIHQSLAVFLPMGDKLWQPYFRGLLAEAYGVDRSPEAGLNALEEALAEMDTMEPFFYRGELYRLKGVLLLCQSAPDESQAETCFHDALSSARRQQARSWELRAATSLARLWQSQGKRQEAYELLQPVYGWFTEGFDTADLKEAKGLLDRLEAGDT